MTFENLCQARLKSYTCSPAGASLAAFRFWAGFTGCRSLLPLYRSLLPLYRSLLPLYRSLLPLYWSLLPLYRSLLPLYRSLLPLYWSLLPFYRSLLPLYRSLLPVAAFRLWAGFTGCRCYFTLLFLLYYCVPNVYLTCADTTLLYLLYFPFCVCYVYLTCT